MDAKSLIDENETQFLRSLLQESNARRDFLEIGSYSGDGSTSLFVEYIRKCGGSLHCVDLFQNQAFEERCRVLLDGIDSKILKGYSAELAEKNTNTYQFMFIDGDHGYPRLLPNKKQSGVACDILAWNSSLEVGGIIAFHDYTGNATTYGSTKYLPIEYAVDSLCAPPFYECIGHVDRIIALRKLRTGVLPHTHRPKRAPEAYRNKWKLLDDIQRSGGDVTVFGFPLASARVIDSIRCSLPDLSSLSYCGMNDTELQLNSPVASIKKDKLLSSNGTIITAGTPPEEEELLQLLGSENESRCITFMEWFGWHHVGRYGYR
jgi:hypothetical protein